MTNKHDGPRAGSEVTVIQSATPTRLTQAEAERLRDLIEAALTAAKAVAVATHASPFDSQKYWSASEADVAAHSELYAWLDAHGLESK